MKEDSKENGLIITILIAIAIVIVAAILIATKIGNAKANEGKESKTSTLSEIVDRANDKELFAFNTKFTGYSGKQSGMVLKALLAAIDNNNAVNDRKVTLVGGENLDAASTYTVSFEYDSNGYINKAIIK